MMQALGEKKQSGATEKADLKAQNTALQKQLAESNTDFAEEAGWDVVDGAASVRSTHGASFKSPGSYAFA